jgi:hypothetical protein
MQNKEHLPNPFKSQRRCYMQHTAKTCLSESCNTTKIMGRGLCSKHYTQLRREGLPGSRKACIINGCGLPYYGKGLCNLHYQRNRINGDPLYEREPFTYLSKTPEYHCWQMMKQRCTNPRYPEFRYWGGKGIGIYEPWINDFLAFYDYIGKRPDKTYSLDRINGDSNYEPGNVRWASKSMQVYNRRTLPSNNSPYRGVTKNHGGNKYNARINIHGTVVLLGSFSTALEASWCYENVLEQVMSWID